MIGFGRDISPLDVAIQADFEFGPDQVSGLKLWLEADKIVGLSDGDPVASWNDASASNLDATQASSVSRPLWIDGAVNGLPSVRFDGVNDFLATGTFGSPLATATVFLVASKAGTATTYYYDGIASGNRNAFGHQIIGVGEHGIYAGGLGCSAAQAAPTGFHLWTAAFNGASSSLRRDGSAFAAGDAGSLTLTGVTVGSLWSGDAAMHSGDIAALLVYEGVLGSSDRDAVEAYLKTRWGTP